MKKLLNVYCGFIKSNIPSSINDENLVLSYVFDFSKIDIPALINNLNTKNYFVWCKPNENISFIAINSIYDCKKNSDSKYTFLETTFSAVKFERIYYNNSPDTQIFPEFIGASKFYETKDNLWAAYSTLDFFVPEIVLFNQKGTTSLIININAENLSKIDQIFESLEPVLTSPNYLNPLVEIENTSEPEIDEWTEKVNNIIESIKLEKISKLVLSQNLKFQVNHSNLPSVVFKNLIRQSGDCANFIYKKNHSTFFGASPEILIKFNGEKIFTDSLAGSAPRGFNELEDKLFQNNLLKSSKDSVEQKIVTGFLIEQLNMLCLDIEYHTVPTIKKLNNIQHLYTQIKAKLSDNHSVFEVIDALNPTPAVCGYPKSEAFNYLLELENYERGLYSGLIGWFSTGGIGEFYVSIRSALLKDNILNCFAGCGIVKNSDPVSEYNETILKIQPIINAFSDGKN